MTGWILCERDPAIKAIGIFSTQAGAEEAAVDGRYVVIPFNAGDLYEDLISEGAVGAVFMQASGLQTQVEDNANDIINIQSFGATLNNKINLLIAAVQDLQDRVTALESP
jgi:hypothetical protein